MADFRCSVIEEDFGGMHLRIQGQDVWTGFTGDFNASNLLAVYAASELLGAKRDEILTALSSMGPVPGRLEKVASKGTIYGISITPTPPMLCLM